MNSAPRMLALGAVVLIFSIFNLLNRKEHNCTYRFLRLTIFPVAVLYVAWTLITLLLAVNPGEGIFDLSKSLLTLGLLVYWVQFFLTRQSAFEVVVKSVMMSAVIATSIGMYQYLTMVRGSSDYELYTALYAVKGLMANKNQFAISLMLMLPFVSYGLFTFKKGWRALAGYSVLMILVNIVIIQTRSVWIATLFMMMTFALLSPVFLLNNNLKGFLVNNKKVLSVSLAVFLIVSIVAVMLIRSSGTSGLMKEQVTSTFSTQSSNAQWRIKMWNASLQLAADNPWLGVGAGNWKSAIIPYYHTNFESEYQNWRRPHNDFLWVATEKGIPGLMLFILLFGLIFFYGYKILFSEKNRNRLLITILMLSGVGAYMVVSLFTFPLERINQQIYLVLMMAVVVSIFFQSKNTIAHKLNPFKWVNLAILVFSGFSIYYAFLFLNSELTVGKIAASMNAGRPNRTIKYADKAYSPFTTVDYNNIPIKMYRGVANMHLKRYDESLRDLQAALKDFPNQVAVLNNLAIVSSELNKNKQAIEYLDQALYLFPHYEESLSNKVIVYYRDKQYKNAYIALLHQSTRKPNKQYKDFKAGLERLINKEKGR